MEEKTTTAFIEKLLKIQKELKAPKNQFNGFGKYAYRSAEDILEAVKPHLSAAGLLMTISDKIVSLDGRFYIKSIVKITDGETAVITEALAREEENKKGQDSSQTTGSTSSYARKYALNGMFLIDDTKDSDNTNDGSGGPKKATKTKAEPEEKKQEPAVDKKVLLAGTKGFEKAAKWIADTDGMVIDLLDVLKDGYSIAPDVETLLAARAAELRKEKA